MPAVLCVLGITLPQFWLLSANASRSYNYDESVAVGTIISSGSPVEALTRQVLFNNHPLFAAVQSGWWALGWRTEALQRISPVAYAVGAIALLVAWLAVRWGVPSALAGGAVLASNPMFVDLARTVRGYSLVVLGCVMALVGLAEYARDHSRSWLLVHGAGIVIALGTHFFSIIPLGVIVVAAVALLGVDRRLVTTWAIASVGAAFVYIAIIDDMLATTRTTGRRYRADLGEEILRDLFGSRVVAVLIGSLGAVGVVALFKRSRRIGVAAAVSCAAAVFSVVAIWQVLQPSVLHSRYFVGFVPLFAIGVAAAIRQAVVLVVPLALAVALLAPRLLDIRECEVPIRQVAEIVDAGRHLRLDPCLIGGDSVVAYTSRPRELGVGQPFTGCDVFVRVGSWGLPMVTEAAEHFAHQWQVGGRFEAFAQWSPAELGVDAGLAGARRSTACA